MNNAIVEVGHRIHTLMPTQAEVWFTVVAEQITPGTQIRGRVTGPRCASRMTVEIAYPLQPLLPLPEGTPPLTVRAVIPEPSLWEPASPFLYRARVELWQDGERCDVREFDVGLRMR
jgi:hypothetical protein